MILFFDLADLLKGAQKWILPRADIDGSPCMLAFAPLQSRSTLSVWTTFLKFDDIRGLAGTCTVNESRNVTQFL
jgi:hypothetical protein